MNWRVTFQSHQWRQPGLGVGFIWQVFYSYWIKNLSSQLCSCANVQTYDGPLESLVNGLSTVTHQTGPWYLMLNNKICKTNEWTGDKLRRPKSQLYLRLLWKKMISHNSAISDIGIISQIRLSYFQGIYHLQTFTKCLVFRTIKDVVSRSLSHKLQDFIWGFKFIKMLTWLNRARYT